MKIKCEMEMNYYEFMGRFADHYRKEQSCAWEYICAHTDNVGHYDNMLTNIIMNAMDVKFYDFRFAFERYVNEERKINNHNMENCVAFGLTLEYFGIKNLTIDIEDNMWYSEWEV